MDTVIQQRALVIGGGIAGCVLALLLKQKGWQPIIVEKVKRVGASGLALVVQPNGMKVLNKAGAVDVALDGTLPWKHWNDWSAEGEFLGGPGSTSADGFIDRYGWPSVGISRTKLQTGLKRVIETAGIPFLEGWRLKDIRTDRDSVTIISEDGRTLDGAFAVGADGIKSATRDIIFKMQGGHDRDIAFTGILTVGGLSPSAQFFRERQGLNLFWGSSETVITHPVEDGFHLWGVTVPLDHEASESWQTVSDDKLEEEKRKYLELFKDWHPAVSELVRTSKKMQMIGLYNRGDLDVSRWYNERLVLVGDAAHPTTPHAGQGANQCMEDAWALFSALPHYNPSENYSSQVFQDAFRQYAEARHAQTSLIMKESLQQGEYRVLRGANANEEGRRRRNEMLRQKWSKVESLTVEQDRVMKQPFEDKGGYQKWSSERSR